MTDEQIARVLHEVLRAHNAAHGDASLPPWEQAYDWQIEASLKAVEFHRQHPDASPAAIHDAWVAQKHATGWVYGPEKDADQRTHPMMVPYDDLPPHEQAKDHIAAALVRALVSDVST
jgi:hypothetical protein